MKEKGKAYVTPRGYAVRLQRGGIGAEDVFRPRTNDFAVEPLIDAAMDRVCRYGYGWTDQVTAQQVLDNLAVEHGWVEWLAARMAGDKAAMFVTNACQVLPETG